MKRIEKEGQMIILGYKKVNKTKFPVILCENDRGMMKFWCHYCKSYHYHGMADGLRASHCYNQDSEYGNGYIITMNENYMKEQY